MNVIFYPNGNTAVLDENGQRPELQASWIALFFRFLKENGVDPCEQGFTLPDGKKAKAFITENGYNWKVE